MLRKSMPMLAGVLLAALVGASGCTSMNSMGTSSIFRGQEPAANQLAAYLEDAPMPEATPSEESAAQQDAGAGYDQGMVYDQSQQPCPTCQTYPAFVCQPGGFCQPGGCRSCGQGNALDWYPRHHLSYSYTTPRNLKYPCPSSPAGTVVYPYYTLRGPTDFFMQ